MPEQYDNTNRGAAWATKAVKGTLDVGGKKFYMDIVQTGRQPPSPTYTLYATSADTRTLYGCGLFAPKKPDSKAKATGVLNLYNEGGEQWANLFVNTPDPQKPKRPLVGVTVQAKDPQPAQEPAAGPPYDADEPDDIPF